jgi:predicted ribosome quality control (RQC) complex YloA/Tae2 family protein
MLSLKELKRAAFILEKKLAGTILHRQVETVDGSLALQFRGRDADRIVILCPRPDFARVGIMAEIPSPAEPHPSFMQYMRAHLARAAFGGIQAAETDRQLTVRLLSGEGVFELILSILGPRSNVYLVNPFGVLVHCMRPLEDTRRELSLGGKWAVPDGGVRSEGVDRWEAVPDADYLTGIESHYQTLEKSHHLELLAHRIETALGREESFLARKASNLCEDLGESRQAEAHRRRGELLKASLHLVREGDLSLEAEDFETGEKVTIPLDASLSPPENLEAYFKKYQKEQRGVGAIEEQIQSVRSALEAIERLRERLKTLSATGPDGRAGIEDLASDQLVRRLLGRHYPKPRPVPVSHAAPKGKPEVSSRLQPKRYRTSDGLEVWVGKNDEGNDYLTTRLARGNDLFLHLEGYPGSHVVLRTEGKVDPPPASLLAACELAVHYSKLKNAGRADVHVAFIKDVKKPRGAKKGLVYVARGKTVHLRRDPKRLEDILASRLDE